MSLYTREGIEQSCMFVKGNAILEYDTLHFFGSVGYIEHVETHMRVYLDRCSFILSPEDEMRKMLKALVDMVERAYNEIRYSDCPWVDLI